MFVWRSRIASGVGTLPTLDVAPVAPEALVTAATDGDEACRDDRHTPQRLQCDLRAISGAEKHREFYT